MVDDSKNLYAFWQQIHTSTVNNQECCLWPVLIRIIIIIFIFQVKEIKWYGWLVGDCLYLEVYPGPTKGGPGVSLHPKKEVKEIKWVLCARFGWPLWSQYLLLCTLKSSEALGQQTRCLCAVWLLQFSSKFQYILGKLSEAWMVLSFIILMQDTLYLHYGKQYLRDCYIEGSVDFIFGNSTALLEHCHIHCKSAGYVTAQSRKSSQETTGYVFLRYLID